MKLATRYADIRENAENENGKKYPGIALSRLDSQPSYRRFCSRFLPYVRSVNEAHLVMLYEQNILNGADAGKIMRAIEEIDYSEYADKQYTGEFEDLYFEMESEIIQKSEGVGGNLHLGRSRNDMSMTWSRLSMRTMLLSTIEKLIHFQNAVRLFAYEERDTLYVIHTHTQHAQPGIFGHYYLGFLDVIDRCIKRFKYAYDVTNESPMGAAAATTTGFPISRERVGELLGFDKLIDCAYDAIGNFEHFNMGASAVSLCALDLGRTVTDMLLWATEEEKMIILSDAYSSTSSIMPQKRNPIALEHLRGSLSMTKALADAVSTAFLKSPYGDISDHEDVEDVIAQAFASLERCIDLFEAVIATMDVNRELLRQRAYESFSVVTEIADELFRSCNIPFRKAHGFVSYLVRKAGKVNFNLKNITREFFIEAFREYFNAEFEGDFEAIRLCIDPQRFVNMRNIPGGTGPKAMEMLLEQAKEKVAANRSWYEGKCAALQAKEDELKHMVQVVSNAENNL